MKEIKIYSTDYSAARILGVTAATYRSLNGLIKNINPGTPPINEDKLTMFFYHGGILVCAENTRGKIVGMATLIFSYKVNGSSARIEHVSVLPDYEGNRIASRMLALLMDKVRARKVRRVDLTCDPKNLSANKLYASFGFKVRRGSHQMRLELKA